MITITTGNELTLQVSQIMEYGAHTCPNCGGEATINKYNQPYAQGRFLDYPLSDWSGYVGYVFFGCKNSCYEAQKMPRPLSTKSGGELLAGLRVVRIGDAMVPLGILDHRQAYKIAPGMGAAYLNAQRVRQAVAFLNTNAAPEIIAGVSEFQRIVLSAMHGQLAPRQATDQLISHARFTVRGPGGEMSVEEAIDILSVDHPSDEPA